MNLSCKGHNGLKKVLVIAGAFFLFFSCSPLIHEMKQNEESAHPARTAVAGGFRSEEYIVYKAKAGDTPESVAEHYLGDRKRAWLIEEANRPGRFEEDQLIIIPLADKNKGGLYPNGYQTVPILCYHRLADHCAADFCISKDLFEEQLRYIKENGYRVLSMNEFSEFLAYRRSIPRKSVILTLDDGYSSTYDIAYPILKKFGFTATLFIYTDFIGTSKAAMTWDQLKKMKADGFEIGSHSSSHCSLTRKRDGENEQAYLDRVKRELVLSKQLIDKKLGQDTAYFAFPYGEYNPSLLALCRANGYKLGLSVKRGGNPFFSDPLTVKRDQVVAKDMESFIAMLKTFYEIPLE